MTNQSNWESRKLDAWLNQNDEDDDGPTIIGAYCVTRKKSGLNMHVIINGTCIFCKGITEDEYDRRVAIARRAARWADDE